MIMLSEEIKKEMRYAKDFCVTDKYFIFYSGKSASIFNKALHLVHKITGLNYVYAGSVSADGQYLLLLGMENLFYTVSLNDFSLKKHRIPKPYREGLRGRGCFAFEGNGFLLAPEHENTNLGVIREFASVDAQEFRDYLDNQYSFYHLLRLERIGKYLAIGHDTVDDKWWLFLWRNDNIERYEIKGFDDALMEIHINEEQGNILLIGAEGTHLCDLQGNQIATDTARQNSRMPLFVETHLRHEILCSFSDSRINTDIAYIGTPSHLLMVQMTDGRLLKEKKIEFGVHRIHELEVGLLLILTWGGV